MKIDVSLKRVTIKKHNRSSLKTISSVFTRRNGGCKNQEPAKIQRLACLSKKDLKTKLILMIATSKLDTKHEALKLEEDSSKLQ